MLLSRQLAPGFAILTLLGSGCGGQGSPDGGADAATGDNDATGEAMAGDLDAGGDATVAIPWPDTIPIMAAARAPATGGATVCYASGWCWADPTPIGGRVAVWAVADDDVWVVSTHGVTRHFDGKAWTTVATPTTRNLTAVWGSASDEVWASGEGVILRWDGAHWTTVDAGTLGGDSLWGRGPTDLWVGDSDSPGGIAHFDGNAWTTITRTPATDVFETTDGDFYGTLSLGNLGQLVDRPAAIDAIPRLLSPPAPLTPLGVWAASRTDVWVAQQVSLLRFDDTSWQEVLSLHPMLPSSTSLLQKVRGADASNVWVSSLDGSMLRWNGASLERWPAGVGLVDDISARAPNDVWVGGGAGALSHFDGTAWQRHGAGPQINALGSLHAVGSNDVWAMGRGLTGQTILHGSAAGDWDEIPNDFPWLTALEAAWGAAANDVWVAGYDYRGPGQLPKPLIDHWNGVRWSRTTGLSADGEYDALWGSATNDVWIAGSDLRHWDGASWNVVTVPGLAAGTFWLALAGAGKNEVWAAAYGPDGTPAIFEWDGAKWTDRTPAGLSVGVPLRLTARAPHEVFAWGGPTLRRFDGKAWTTILVVQDQDIGNVAARTGEVWRDNYGDVSVWNGTTWASSNHLGAGNFTSLLATSKDVWFGCQDLGFGSGIMRLAR